MSSMLSRVLHRVRHSLSMTSQSSATRLLSVGIYSVLIEQTQTSRRTRLPRSKIIQCSRRRSRRTKAQSSGNNGTKVS